jgi:hypothetical protein
MRHAAWALAAILMLSGTVLGEEPSDDEMREEAHRTIYRRFSAQARTETLGLGDEATAVVDLLLDLERNREEVQARRAPRSRLFAGTAHGVVEIVDGKLVCRADFVRFTIDRAEMPLEEVPEVLEAALDAKRFAAARTAEEDEARFAHRRRMLLTGLVGHAGEHLARMKAWSALRPRIAAECLAAIRAKPGRALFALLDGLSLVGDDATAATLISEIDDLCEGKPAYYRAMYVRGICRIPGKRARAFLLESLSSEDGAIACAALQGVPKEPDEEVLAVVLAFLAEDSKAPWRVVRAAIGTLERNGGAKARAATEAAFGRAKEEEPKYAFACALTRMGSDAAVPWLEKLLADLEKRGDRASAAKAGYVRRLLAERER